MLFDAGDNAVDLRIKAVENGFDIRGQVLGAGFENGEVEVMGPKGMIHENLSSTSQFSFGGLAAGDYSVTIKRR